MGHLWSLVREVFPPATQFNASDVPDMSGKVVLVTGANSGLGRETTRVLLTKNAKVYIACRDKAKGEAAIRELQDSTGKEAVLLQLNLSNLRSVKAAAEEFLSKEPLLNVLFNNAGVMSSPAEMLTDDGYDLQFGTNVVGHFYFTKLVMPALLAAAATSSDRTARVGFSSHEKDEYIDSLWPEQTGNIMFSAELARRYGDRGIVPTALAPGSIKTELFRHDSFTRTISNLFFYDVSYGALTLLYAGTTAEGAKLNGKYLIPFARIGEPRADTQDLQQGTELWNWLEEQVKDV
ncbi:hypothetical protein AZE42_08567 [Rhizopogon vesiculosus]|uniref:NAD(P)-binding protein n=1 Tax=Rhizopogon vesiculosus TaxID=180088 RepID=A0A1J8QZF9_9AGAM|nr:hypothetical protein AZE42_08567 [Rhizopogon vesiculosus]